MDEVGHEGVACGGKDRGKNAEEQFAGEEHQHGVIDLREPGDGLLKRGGDDEEKRAGEDDDGDAGEISGDHECAAREAVGECAGERAQQEEGEEHHDIKLGGVLGFVGLAALHGDQEVEHDDEMDAVSEGGDDVAGPEKEKIAVFEKRGEIAEDGGGGRSGRDGLLGECLCIHANTFPGCGVWG